MSCSTARKTTQLGALFPYRACSCQRTKRENNSRTGFSVGKLALSRDKNMAIFCRSFLLLACLLVPGVCLGGGTVSPSEIDSLLRQKPSVRNFLMSSLDMDDTVMAALRFGHHTKLGGARMGPYMIQARPKASKDALPLEVVLCTDARFFDASGQVTEDEINAVRLEEKLTVVILRELNRLPAIPNCP